MYGCGIFIDLKKAFGTVNHTILLNKLKHYDIRGSGLKWFTSYLSNSSQYVSINNTTSDIKHITCGVPQGQYLDPYYFCYIFMIYQIFLISFIFFFLQMIQIFILKQTI